jgi:mRNA interferase HigB
MLPPWEHGSIRVVKVIARRTLNDFLRNRVQRKERAAVKSQLDAWFAEAEKATWRTPAELKQQYGSASIITSERVVFNIKGNHYRLIVAISYDYQIMLIKWLGTHKEYDQINAAEVEYDKSRYSDTSNSE